MKLASAHYVEDDSRIASASKKGLLYVALIFLTLLSFLQCRAHSAQTDLSITYNKNDKAAATCARALETTVGSLGEEIVVRFLPQDSDRAHRDKGLRYYVELVGYGWSDGKIERIPFLFRDAEHFQAYLTSDVYAEFVAFSTLDGSGAIAHAYGGFFQMFSYEAAVTEPKHFYRRQIGGIAQAPSVYAQFGGEFAFGLGFFGGDVVAEDARRMAGGDRLRNMVEGLLISALENNLDKNARYVNLVSSTVNVVYFETSSYFKELPETTIRRIRSWIRVSASACSAENFQNEVEVLDRLKRAGLQVVPFNRRAMYEAGVISALQNAHYGWTLRDLDKIASLGKRDPNLPLPSQLLRRAGPEAAKYEQEAVKNRKSAYASLADRSVGERIEEIKSEEFLRFGDAVSKAGRPKKTSQLIELAKQLPPAERASISQITKLLERQIPGCTNCNKSLSWALVAQGYFLLGDFVSANEAYSKALSIKDSQNEPIVLWTGALIRDPRAVQNALQFCPEHCRVEKPQLLNDEERSKLVLAAVILDELGERNVSAAAIKSAAAFAPRRMRYTIAAAEFAVHPSEENWGKLVLELRGLDYSAWTVSQLPVIPAHWIDVHLARTRIQQYELLADKLGALRPLSERAITEKTWIWERSEKVAWEFGVRSMLPKYLAILASDAASLESEFAKGMVRRRIVDLQKRVGERPESIEKIQRLPVGEQARALLEELKRTIQTALLKRL
ncbi:MAG: hypothetical protein KF742_04995 [Cryobacterium sp.]|nr:hypothetical protein [Cryobacterium sp.]MBX3549042.1 hypothetical protein [Xanthobacteraceae bacterium]